MGKKAKQLKTDLIRRIQEYPDDLQSQIRDMSDITITKPQKTEKKFSKKELIVMIEQSYKDL